MSSVNGLTGSAPLPCLAALLYHGRWTRETFRCSRHFVHLGVLHGYPHAYR